MPQDPAPQKPPPAQLSDEDEEDNFKEGKVIVTSKYNWTVVKLLGDEGRFGMVYQVKNEDGTEGAMKVEYGTNRRQHRELKMELAILKKVTTLKHFTKVIDRGRKEEEHKIYYIIVVQLVGRNLYDLKSSRSQKVFSFATALGVAHQCLEGLEEMHKHGFIHRDLRPQYFACGLATEKHVIYIIDFGIARKYVDSNNELKAPRDSMGFKGNVRFAPLACHRGIERSPKDDCESWFYMLVDFINPAGLPWRKVNDRNDTMRLKEEICHGRTDNPLYGDLKHTKELAKILGYISQLQYHSRVDYSFIYKLLARAGNSAEVNIEAPYDWETSDETKT